MARPIQMSDEAILEALRAHPEATSAEVADALGMGQSTAAKRLAALEQAGSVRRLPGGRATGRRVPDHWCAAEGNDAGAEPSPLSAPAEVPGRDAVPLPADGARRDAAPERPRDLDTAEPGAGDTAVTGAAGRLGRGALGSLVRDYLAARPDECFGPAALGKALGRSQGAISNSLAAMAERGEVVLAGDKPRRYRIARGR